jgi:acetyl/propionyl-CoA carboxylase alpha subunit
MSKLTIRIDGRTYEVELNPLPMNGSGISVSIAGKIVHVQTNDSGTPAGGMEWFMIDGRAVEVSIDSDFNWIETRRGTFPLKIQDQSSFVSSLQNGDGRVKAPIPGQVTQLLVQVGEQVTVGQPLLILEAMKMENEIRSPRSGKILTINVVQGQSVSLNELLFEIE